DQAFGEEQRTLQIQIPPESAQLAAGADHAMAGNGRIRTRAHDVADRARCSRPASHGGHITVGGDASGRNAANNREHARREDRRSAIGLPGRSARAKAGHGRSACLAEALSAKAGQNTTRSPPPAFSPPTSIFTAWPPVGVKSFVPC